MEQNINSMIHKKKAECLQHLESVKSVALEASYAWIVANTTKEITDLLSFLGHKDISDVYYDILLEYDRKKGGTDGI